MGAQSIVVQPGEGAVSNFTPGRSLTLKLRGGETGDSIMMFEETVPAGTKSTLPPTSRQRRDGLCPERRGHFQDRR